jgi:GTP cyclohydrolase I
METFCSTTQDMEYSITLPANTPPEAVDRWQKAINEMVGGYSADPELDVVFDVPHDEIIISRGIEFSSLCEHHLFPFFGTADVAYIPRSGIVGLSKLARTVDCFARRFQTQERMSSEIADAIQAALDPVAVAVIIKAAHTCQKCRGITKNGQMITSVMRGAFRENPMARRELLQLLSL